MLTIFVSIKIIMQEKNTRGISYLTSVNGKIAKNVKWYIKPLMNYFIFIWEKKKCYIIIFILYIYKGISLYSKIIF